MSLEITLLANPFYIELPHHWAGWLFWFSLLGLGGYWLWQSENMGKTLTRAHWFVLVGLLVMVPLANLFIILRLPPGDALPPPGKPIDPVGPALLVFSALPWVLGGILLGPVPAAFLGALSGLILAGFDTHSIFTPLEIGLLATFFSYFIHQTYRTRTYRLLRQPLAAAVVVVVAAPLLLLVGTLFLVDGTLVTRIDYALTHLLFDALAVCVPVIIAALFAQALVPALPASWRNRGPWQASPAERRLETRFLYNMMPLAVLLLVGLVVGDWVVAGNAARDMLRERMVSSAQVASETVPFFLEAGQNLIQQLAENPRLISDDKAEQAALLAQEMRSVPFFRQLYLLDSQGNVVTGYPQENYLNSQPPPSEMVGIQLALQGVKSQNYTIPPVDGELSAQISFLAAVVDSQDSVQGVLVGRADLASNPFTQPVLSSIRNTVGADGDGMLLDEEQRVLYHTRDVTLMNKYTGRTGSEVMFYDDKAADGTRRLVYYQPVMGHPWSVVLSVPARRAQEIAFTIASPLLIILLVLFTGAVILLKVGVRMITSSLHVLGAEANRISSGQLDHALPLEGADEIAQLRRSFEQMRVSLKGRLDELNCLLKVSQGVAASLEMEQAVKPVLESALLPEVCSARVVLVHTPVPGFDLDDSLPSRFGMGPSSELYSYLDEHVLVLARQQERVLLSNLSRVRILHTNPGSPRPEALIALALRHENLFYGTLWLAYDSPHQFTDDEIRFLATMAGQAALAAANARLFQSAEIGRQRLEAILASTPDPVLVTDQRNRLLLSNPAAWQVLGLGTEPGGGQLIQNVTTQEELVKLLSSTAEDKQSAEICLPDGRIYLAMASMVLADGQRVGRVCVMRDITYFKELDALKSEFVSTVSHDLRSPLTLMRGYATMLEMVGDLNDQQTGYVRKIVTAVESMSRLVSNLLDLGRIEAGVDLALEMVPIHDVVERVTNALQMDATQKKIQLSVDIPTTTIPLIEADQALLQQALHNLVENAIKYTEAGGKIKVCVSARPNGMVFDISDSGIGIAPVDQPHLFEKFFRGAQREAKKTPGTGLGLAIVKSIAERHGGRVWVESQLGKGSSFFLLIPLRQPKKEGKILRSRVGEG